MADQGVKKFLVDARLTTSRPSATATYAHGVALSSFGKFIGVRFAIVTSNIDATDSLLTKVAANRVGIIQLFESRDDVLAWLTDS